MRLAVPAMLFLASLSLPVTAQETRVAPAGHVPPLAQVEDVDWLVGNWSGPGIEGAWSLEGWLPPSDDTMVGTFVQENAEGGVMFTEHMYLTEQDGSLVLLLKHFNPDLTSWEERDDMVRFPLVALEECAAYFNGLTYRCTEDGGLLVAVRMRHSDGSTSELTFNFERSRPLRAALCPDAQNTLEINDCYGEMMMAADMRRAEYLAAAVTRLAGREAVQEDLRAADRAFATYRDAACGAVYEKWREGTIRVVQSLTCQIRLTDSHVHAMWQDWLTYPDSTPPDLPEPQPRL